MHNAMMKKVFKHHYVSCLSTHEKMCIAALIGWSFMKGVCVGMYLARK
jgi:predicted Kef-type K+ transport protein